MQSILRSAALRSLEQQFAAARPPLMERAGAAAAQLALRLLAGRPGSVAILCGPGNNGGDGFVLARLLREAGRTVHASFAGDPARLPADAAAAYRAFLDGGGATAGEPPGHAGLALAVDALFGIGLARPIEGRYRSWIDWLNAAPCPVLALDAPSGLDAQTGRAGAAAVRATHTATFIALKAGLLTLDGPDFCGEVSVHDLGLPPAEDGALVETEAFAERLVPRARNSHKGQMGDAGVIGGAAGMVGAALLAGRAALKLGVGRVFVGLLAGEPSVDAGQPELMLRPARAVLDAASALALGPGLGREEPALLLLHAGITADKPLVLDADALNLVADHPVLARHLSRRSLPALLTPHPAEAGRLLGVPTAEVQADRVAAALQLARRFQSMALVKGCGSVIAAPDGRWWINATGNPGMASAGMGDVLAGIALALLAQGWPPEPAMLAAVHLHGAAADLCVREGAGPVGLAAGELIERSRSLFNGWIAERAQARRG